MEVIHPFRPPHGQWTRETVLDEFNQSTLDDVGPVRGTEQEMKVLSVMNSLVDDYEEFAKSLAPSVVAREQEGSIQTCLEVLTEN